jgi:hypothetical protein
VPQLPRVAVLGPDLAGAAALVAFVDAGLDATGVGGEPPPAAAAVLAAHALTDRWLVGAGRADGAGRTAGDGSTPTITRAAGAPVPAFAIRIGGELVGRWDAVVVTAPALAPSGGAGGPDAPRFGGVFHSVADGVYVVGAPDEPAPPPGPPDPTLARAQAGWVAEYLRGRYRLPAYQAMAARPSLRRPGLWRGAGRRHGGAAGYVRALERELRAGRARAAAAGYPLPLPAAPPG